MSTTTKARATRSAPGAKTVAKRYTISDGTLMLNLEVEGKWLIVTSPLDPELVTQAKSIEEAFRMAYDAKALLDKYRAELSKKTGSRASVLPAPPARRLRGKA